MYKLNIFSQAGNTLRHLLSIIAIYLVFSTEIFAQVPPLLDRAYFFDDPEVASAKLSPDGAYVSFLKPLNGTKNIWIKRREAPFDDAIPVTEMTERPISSYFWSRDGKYLLFVMDQGGDENFNVFAVNVAKVSKGEGIKSKNLTQQDGVRTIIYHISRKHPDLLFVGLNIRDKSWHDLYSLRISTGELQLIRENSNRYSAWIFDHDDRLRVASRSDPNGNNELWRIESDGQTLLFSWTVFDQAIPYSFTKDNQYLYLSSNIGEGVDLLQLYQLNIESGDVELLEVDPDGKVDFGNLRISEKTLDILYTVYSEDRNRMYFKDSVFEQHFKKLKNKLGEKELSIINLSLDERFWLVNSYADVDPGTVYLYDMETEKLDFQYQVRPNLQPNFLSKMTSIRYPSSDGLEIQAYLTLPKGFGEKMLPLIVMPHGGPWARDYWGFDFGAQFIANRGYAVLQPNFRGSTGFGKQFLNAGNGEWGGLMQDDITWGVNHLIETGVVDPGRIGIFGISYGGYATLAGMAYTHDLYAAGASAVGPSNLNTLLNSIPPYWEGVRKQLYARMADPSTDSGREWLKKVSPLHAADQIKSPLMIIHGANDPRVSQAESEQIVDALRRRDFPVEYLLFPDEGHGIEQPLNIMVFTVALETFFSKHLGGRFQESMSDDLAQKLNEVTVNVSAHKAP